LPHPAANGECLGSSATSEADGAKTDDRGRFRFVELQWGRRVVEARVNGVRNREFGATLTGDGKVGATPERPP
jgi:hypothetical protein